MGDASTVTLAPTSLLRGGLLDGIGVVVCVADAGERPHSVAAETRTPAREGSAGESIRETCSRLGARVCTVVASPCQSPEQAEAQADERLREALSQLGSIDLVAVDGGSLFEAGREPKASTDDPRGALRSCLQCAWNLTRAVADVALLPSGKGGRIVYLAPAPCLGTHAHGARAGLENLARTLSIEWARHAITVVAIAPGNDTTAQQLAALTAYLGSPAGAYFSGCLLDLTGGGPRPPRGRET